MTGQIHFTNLRNLLAEIYPDEPSMRRLLADAGINAARVELDSTAINNWHALLAEAEKAKRIDALLTVVQGEYGENADLQAAIAAYGQGAPASAPLPPSPQAEPAPAPATAPVAPGQSIDIFLSYSRHDTAVMQRLQAELTAAGFSVWIDDLDLEPGTPSWQRAVETAIHAARCMVVILSPTAKTSVWVGRELSYAETLGLPIFPVLVEGDTASAVPISLINHQRVDLRAGWQGVNERLVPALRRQMGRQGTTPHPNPPQVGEGTVSRQTNTSLLSNQQPARAAGRKQAENEATPADQQPPPSTGEGWGGGCTTPHPNPPQVGEGTVSGQTNTSLLSNQQPARAAGPKQAENEATPADQQPPPSTGEGWGGGSTTPHPNPPQVGVGVVGGPTNRSLLSDQEPARPSEQKQAEKIPPSIDQPLPPLFGESRGGVNALSTSPKQSTWRNWLWLNVTLAALLLLLAYGVFTYLNRRQPVVSTPTKTPTATLTVAPVAQGVVLPANSVSGTIWTMPNFKLPFSYVPGGTFQMGSPAGTGESDEQPRHPQTVTSFWIGQTEMTNAQYDFFVKADGYSQDQWWTAAGLQWRNESKATTPDCWQDEKWNQPDYPVVCLSWYEAVAYTRWLSDQTGLTVRLPTEAEWEYAARGTDGRIYPWDNDAPTAQLLNYAGSNLSRTTTVGSYPDGASPEGALDMAGNVWEWTSTIYKPYPYSADNEGENENSADSRVVRGGSWFNVSPGVRSAARYRINPDYRDNDLGLRLVVSAPQ